MKKMLNRLLSKRYELWPWKCACCPLTHIKNRLGFFVVFCPSTCTCHRENKHVGIHVGQYLTIQVDAPKPAWWRLWLW